MAAVSYGDVETALGDACRAVVDPGMNVYDDWPKSTVGPVAPAVVILPRSPDSVDYGKALGGGCDDFHFVVAVIAGRVTEVAAQKRVAELVSRGSPLMRALRAVRVGNGPCIIRSAGISETTIGMTRYKYARIAGFVKA